MTIVARLDVIGHPLNITGQNGDTACQGLQQDQG
jgi:hypothetical protein